MVTNSKFSKILVAVDGSSQSSKAVDNAISLAKSQNAHLLGISVYTVSYFGPHAITDKMFMDSLNRQIKVHKEYLSQAKTKAERKKVKLETHLIEGESNTGLEIIDFAKKHKIDLIVMGSRGLTKFKKLLIGSVASTVVSHAPCPVMIIR